MPAESKAQSRYLNMKFGHQWVKEHNFDNSPKKLPKHVKKQAREAMQKIGKGLRA